MTAPIKSTPDSTNITGLILAGGRASRMESRDKGLLIINGESFVSVIANRLAPQCKTLIINANRNIETYSATGYPVAEDTLSGFQGPLAGMLSGLKTMNTEWLITVPCDGPFLDPDYVHRMAAAVSTDSVIAIAKVDGRFQPVYTLIHHSLLLSLEGYLSSGERKIDRWVFQHNYEEVDFSDTPGMFENINTPEQLEQINKC
jgi:molybdenum cofactor guanylyltransferase